MPSTNNCSALLRYACLSQSGPPPDQPSNVFWPRLKLLLRWFTPISMRSTTLVSTTSTATSGPTWCSSICPAEAFATFSIAVGCSRRRKPLWLGSMRAVGSITSIVEASSIAICALARWCLATITACDSSTSGCLVCVPSKRGSICQQLASMLLATRRPSRPKVSRPKMARSTPLQTSTRCASS